jgi:hypothetical protein
VDWFQLNTPISKAFISFEESICLTPNGTKKRKGVSGFWGEVPKCDHESEFFKKHP